MKENNMSGIGSYLVRVEGGLAKDLSAIDAAALSAAKNLTAYVDGIFVNDIDPVVENFFQKIIPDEIAALKPFAVQAFQEIITDVPAFLSGGWAAFAAALAPTLLGTVEKAVAAGKTVAQADALTAVSAVLTDVQAVQPVAAAVVPDQPSA